MPTFEYSFHIEETVHKRCTIEVEAKTLEEAMASVEEQSPWMWDVHYGKDEYYEVMELMSNNPRDRIYWEKIDDLTYDEKVEKYREGLYKMEPPPGPSFYWRGPKPWIAWIDSHGEWLNEPQ